MRQTINMRYVKNIKKNISYFITFSLQTSFTKVEANRSQNMTEHSNYEKTTFETKTTKHKMYLEHFLYIQGSVILLLSFAFLHSLVLQEEVLLLHLLVNLVREPEHRVAIEDLVDFRKSRLYETFKGMKKDVVIRVCHFHFGWGQPPPLNHTKRVNTFLYLNSRTPLMKVPRSAGLSDK